MAPAKFHLSFIKREKIAKGTWSFYFDRSEVAYNFYPGQYNRISLFVEGKEISHDFTISSSPLEENIITITTKKSQSNFKNALFALQEREKVQFYGPLGGFYFREEDKKERVFLAGGLGITPFRSMIQYIAGRKLPHKVKLFASFSTEDEIFFYEELQSVAKTSPTIQVVFTLSQHHAVSWNGEKGRISKKLLEKYISNFAEPTYYIVGSESMVNAMEVLLQEIGVEEGKIKIEYFPGY